MSLSLLSPLAAALSVLGVAIGVGLFALRDNIVFFYTPGEIAAKDVKPGVRLRLGGVRLVYRRQADGLRLREGQRLG